MLKTAILSDDARYRYRLTREWDPNAPRLAVLMLNPSTADATQDDNTIRKVVAFSKLLGYGAIDVVNLFAYRATKPADLWAMYRARGYSFASGPLNDWHIQTVAREAGTVLLAYGADIRAASRASEVLSRVIPPDVPTFALAKTAEGFPRHPLYVPYSAVDSIPAEYKANA